MPGEYAAQIHQRLEVLDLTLFSLIESQTSDWDRRSLLALHAAAATTLGSFNYLEIGSYRGGSLQVVMQDPRCARVMSVDPRSAASPDKRWGTYTYENNSTDEMVGLLRTLPGADMGKLTTFELGNDSLRPTDLPTKPDLCFIDGEHTDEAALRDARFCATAVQGSGIIAFHDYEVVKPAIRGFLREAWCEVSACVAFLVGGGGGVFAVELGKRGILRQPVVDRAIASRWHSVVWRIASRPRRSAIPVLAVWAAIPPVDIAIAQTRRWTRVAARGRQGV